MHFDEEMGYSYLNINKLWGRFIRHLKDSKSRKATTGHNGNSLEEFFFFFFDSQLRNFYRKLKRNKYYKSEPEVHKLFLEGNIFYFHTQTLHQSPMSKVLKTKFVKVKLTGCGSLSPSILQTSFSTLYLITIRYLIIPICFVSFHLQ